MYFITTFTIKDKKYINPYTMGRKIVYFTADSEKDVDNYIKSHYLHGNGAYNYTIEPCEEKDLKDLYPTDGFSCVIIPKNDIIGKINISKREFLVEWEARGRANFIVTANDPQTAGKMAEEYALQKKFAYYEDSTHYIITEDSNAISSVKKSGNFITI